jgi:hypothetical protein
MSNHLRRWGGKLGGDHSTVIEAAWRFLPEVISNDLVVKICPGFISAGKNASGRNVVKIIDERGCLLLSIRGASAHQEIRIYASDFPKAKLAIARAVRNADFHLSFGNRLQAQ